MKKSYLILAAAAIFAACSSDDGLTEQQAPQAAASDGSVQFDAYINRTTRSGWNGDVTTDALKEIVDDSKLGYYGFGVFGYYTDNNEYDLQATPNFMYNQQVKWNSSEWTYTPIKYWPNEFGSNAISEDADKVSFFAYAPYVPVTPATGKVADATWGITGLPRNSATGDPIVKYIGSFDVDHSIDLCWGVANGETWTKIQDGTAQTMTAGLPWLNVERPADATGVQKMKFTFKHALAKLNVTIDTYVDGVAPANVTETALTKVYVRSITFQGFAIKGALDLNNDVANKPKWLEYAGTNELVSEDVIIYDGRKDGKEGVAGAVATNEKVLGLNPTIISDDGNTQDGVTGTTKNLFRTSTGTEAASSAAIYVIPTGDPMYVTIEYDVETKDDNLANLLSDGTFYGSSVPNRISKEITFNGSNSLENGKQYLLKLHLGLNSVKFDAEVVEWDAVNNESDTDLPWNAPTYTAGTTSGVLELPASTTTYDFYVRNLTATSSVGGSFSDAVTACTVDPTTTPTSGIVKATITLDANTTVKNQTGTATITESGAGSSTTTVNVTQFAAALGLTATAANGSTDITLGLAAGLTSSGSNSVWEDDVTADATHIKVWKGDGLLIFGTDYTFDASNHKIVLTTAAATGETYKIQIQAGDAAAETISVTVPA